MDQWNQLADQDTVNKTTQSLKANGIDAKFVKSGEQAKEEVLKLIPKGAEVFNETSVTLDTIGIPKELNESGKYSSIRNKLNSMNREIEGSEMQKMGAAPEYAVGSVHAVSEDGRVLIASDSGSQLPAYAYGSTHVIWVVGTQKIVKNTDDGIKRIYEYVLPLENERAQKAYGMGSGVSKLLIINKEKTPGRLTLILVNQKLGF
ncbi:LUD domain-containing protein [Candidatus Daviesbacteria bacterium]|nr:LUD domain-containing protein [Candidatus Daviesbacteria bacterium]